MLPVVAATGALFGMTMATLWWGSHSGGSASSSLGGAWHAEEAALGALGAQAEGAAPNATGLADASPALVGVSWPTPAPTPAPALVTSDAGPGPTQTAAGASDALGAPATQPSPAPTRWSTGVAEGPSSEPPAVAAQVAPARSLTGSCTEEPAGWRDSRGHSCEAYGTNKWCTPHGGYGEGWAASDGYFDDYADQLDISAVEACCECGGFRGRWQRVHDAGGCRTMDYRRSVYDPAFTFDHCQSLAQSRGHDYFDWWVGTWETDIPGPRGQTPGQEWTLCTTGADCDEKYAPYWRGANATALPLGRRGTTTWKDCTRAQCPTPAPTRAPTAAPTVFPTIGQTPTAVSFGTWHGALKMMDGTLWTMGYNNQGQLADGLTANRLSPHQVFTGAQAVAVGEEHTATLKSDGTVWTAGGNAGGQLADGTFNIYTNGPPGTDRSTLQQVLTGAQAVVAGFHSTGVLKSDGTVWMAGSNSYGNLGDGSKTSRVTLKQIRGGCQALAMDRYHSAILTTDGKVFTAGSNDEGQLADGSTTDRRWLVQVFVGAQAVALGEKLMGVLKSDGTVWTAGYGGLGKLSDGQSVQYPDWSSRATLQQVLTGAQAVSLGEQHTAVLKNDDTLWTAGWRNGGRLADGEWNGWRETLQQVFTGVQSVHAGGSYTAVVKSDGSVWAAGPNTYGALGDGTTSGRRTLRQIVQPA